MTTPSNDQPPPASVTAAFARFAQAISVKEGVQAPGLEYRAVSSAHLPDGAVATLWVGTSELVTSRCFHVDVRAKNSQSTSGTGACGTPNDYVSLGRAGTIVVGSAGTHPATAARVTTRHGTSTVEVSAGYFMVPPHLTPDRDTLHTIALIGANGDLLGEVTNMPAPGSAVPADQ